MAFATELAPLLRRDFTRLRQERNAFPNDKILWQSLPGIENSADNLILHLEGNFSESTRQFLIHLSGHFNYHLCQIDYLRRALIQGSAVPFVAL